MANLDSILKSRNITLPTKVHLDHLLVEDWREAARDGGHDPGPVGGAAPSGLLLVFQVLHEGHCGGVVVHDGHLGELGRGREGAGPG